MGGKLEEITTPQIEVGKNLKELHGLKNIQMVYKFCSIVFVLKLKLMRELLSDLS